MQFTNSQITLLSALAATFSFVAASPTFTPQTTCQPSQAGSDSTFNFCAFPKTAADLANTAPVLAYYAQEGCTTIGAQRDNGDIFASGCGSDGDVQPAGWTFIDFFNTPACLPGDQCL